MIFYRIEMELASEFIGDKNIQIKTKDSWEMSRHLEPYNTQLIDLYEEKNNSILMQFATVDGVKMILAYAAYDQKSVEKGDIDIKQDVVKACGHLHMPSCVYIAVVEVSASDYSRAIKRYGIESSRLRELISKFGLDYLRYQPSGYQVSDRIIDDSMVTNKTTAKREMKKLLPDAALAEEDIIAAYKVQKLRNKYYDSNESCMRHMIFTGNPGTAKTTVARLITEIMKENNILKTGTFVEVGRADLVGKYVGWTASIVKETFSRAQGGVLFIDEAYSLVDDSRTFGDEAINTIVQEMENKRGDVIVIFAGYPEKMKDFLAKNEGLRSRIAFHVNFPDYQPEELQGILDKILKDKQYVITDEAREKVMQIFEKVYLQEEYGNGRFVRNLFEQAVNRQAARIADMEGKEISREMLFELQDVDFDTNIVKQYEKKKSSRIGFAS